MKENNETVYYSGTDGKIIRTDHTFIEYDKEDRAIRKTEYSCGSPEEIREYDANGRVWLIRKLIPGMIDPGPDDLYESQYIQYFPDGKIKRQVTTHYDNGIMTYYEIGIEDRSNEMWIETEFSDDQSLNRISVYPEAEKSFKSITIDDHGKILNIQY